MSWKVLWIRSLIALLFIGTLDRMVGGVLSYLHPKVVAGSQVGNVNVVIGRKCDVLLLGSSCVLRGVDDEQLSKALGLGVYNGAADGQSISYARGVYSLHAEQHVPKLVVLDVSYFKDEKSRAGVLSPFYGRNDTVDSVLLSSWRDRVKLASWCFRFNGLFIPILRNLGRQPKVWGYEPMAGHLDVNRSVRKPLDAPRESLAEYEVCLNKAISEIESSGAKVVFLETPVWTAQYPPDVYETFDRIAQSRNVTFLRGAAKFIERRHDPGLFCDQAHLNLTGAKEFTEVLAREMRESLKLGRVSVQETSPK